MQLLGGVLRACTVVTILLSMITITTTAWAVDLSVEQVFADDCKTTPDNFFFNKAWDKKLGILEMWCKYPSIAANNLSNGRRKPQAFASGSATSTHDLNAEKVLNGLGNNGEPLGVVPYTALTFGGYCSNPAPLISLAQPGDVVFSLRAWSESCRINSSSLPTTPVFGIDNSFVFIGDDRGAYPQGLFVSSGSNYGRAIDYYVPGGRLSFALPAFAGVVVAFNTVMISNGFSALTVEEIKHELDVSSNEVYLEVDGFNGTYKESEVSQLLQNPSNKYFGQLINLPIAIDSALTASRKRREKAIAALPAIILLLLSDD